MEELQRLKIGGGERSAPAFTLTLTTAYNLKTTTDCDAILHGNFAQLELDGSRRRALRRYASSG